MFKLAYVNKIREILALVSIPINDFDKRPYLSLGNFIDILRDILFVRHNLQNLITIKVSQKNILMFFVKIGKKY